MKDILVNLFGTWLYQHYGVESLGQLKNVSYRDVIRKFSKWAEKKLGEEFCGE